MSGGIFDIPILRKTRDIINNAYHRVERDAGYTHSKLLAEMEFGICRKTGVAGDSRVGTGETKEGGATD